MKQMFNNKQVEHMYDTIVSFIAHQESILTYCVNELRDMGLDTLLDYQDQKFESDEIVEIFDKSGWYDKLTLKGNWRVNRAYQDEKYHLVIKSDKDIHKYLGYEVTAILEMNDGQTYYTPLMDFEFTITGNVKPFDFLEEDNLSFLTKAKAVDKMTDLLNK